LRKERTTDPLDARLGRCEGRHPATTFGPLTRTTAPGGEVAAFVIGTTTWLTLAGAAVMAIIALATAPWQTFGRGLRPVRAAA